MLQANPSASTMRSPVTGRASHAGGHALGRSAQLLVRHVREDVLPQRQRHPRRLEHAERERDEPDVEVRTAVAPAVEMDAADVAEREDRAVDARGDAAEVRLELLR